MGIFDWLFGKKREKSERDLAKILGNVKNLVFEQMRFKEAAKILEEAAELYPNSAPVQFSLGVTYSRIAGEYKDEDAVRPWALKSGEAFKKAVNLANRYGGLNDEQLAKARESAELIKRIKGIKERKTPSIPEDQRKKIYADFMETKDSELLSGTSLVQDFVDASRSSGNLEQMMQSLNNNAAKAEEAAVAKITKKYGITKGQLIAIEDEGKVKNWPFESVTRR
jgi:tetratricopeptide (TPR) repeat protein